MELKNNVEMPCLSGDGPTATNVPNVVAKATVH